MNELWLIPPIIWLLIGIIANILIGRLNMKLFWNMIRVNRGAKQHADEIMKRTEEKYNKLVAMSTAELDIYLTRIFSLQLELTAAMLIAEKDPDAKTKLYGESLKMVINYVGQTTIDALDYYYGSNYVVKWCELRYKYLEKIGVVDELISNNATTVSIMKGVAHTIGDTHRKN